MLMAALCRDADLQRGLANSSSNVVKSLPLLRHFVLSSLLARIDLFTQRLLDLPNCPDDDNIQERVLGHFCHR